ncbi:hypothetical protein PI126_g10085 [Phytophthora idaei]|nr:hypothetical protein PI126_g10085 [Phytophthora idaei]
MAVIILPSALEKVMSLAVIQMPQKEVSLKVMFLLQSLKGLSI